MKFHVAALHLVCSILVCFNSAAATSLQLSSSVLKIKKSGFPESDVVLSDCQDSKGDLRHAARKWDGAMVVLHGSGGAGSLKDLAQMLSVSTCKHRLRLAVPAAPTRNRNWPFETSQGERQDEYLLELIKKDIPAAWQAPPATIVTNLFIVGISAGATFLMGDFYPRHAHQFKGRALALCGGAWPSQDKIVGIKKLDADFPLFVQIGTSDFLFEQVRAGLTKYSKMGLPLQASFTDAPGHCAFDFNAAVDAVMKVGSK
ncbi:hypothetical protein EBR21_01835 [bacterium]|nr:hypothetical protein [bacterium]